MIDALVMVAAEAAGHEESSKTAFYVAGSVLAAWAVLLSAVGISRADWPQEGGPAKAVMGISTFLVAATVVATLASN